MANSARKLIRGILSEGMKEHYLLEDMTHLLIREIAKENIDDLREHILSGPKGTPFIMQGEAYFASVADELESSASRHHAEGITVADMAKVRHDSYVSLVRVQGDKLKKLGTMGSAGGDRLFIKLFYTDAYIEYLRRTFSDISELTEDRLYKTLYYTFSSPLIHELRHVYDSFRSNGNFTRSKAGNDYFKKYHPLGGEQTVPKSPEQYDDYIRLPHEIWARLTQWLEDYGRFYELDKTIPHVEVNGVKKWFAKMKPIEPILQNIKTNDNMMWDRLSDDNRKRLVKAVFNHWNDAEDELNSYNDRLKKLSL